METICYYHDDLDGIASASVVKEIYPDAIFMPVQYGYEWTKKEVKKRRVIVVDFTMPRMGTLKSLSDDLIWADHHKTAMEKYPELWNDENVQGKRDMKHSGCVLTWQTFFPGKEVPRALKLIEDMDLWLFEYKHTKLYCNSAELKYKVPTDKIWKDDIELMIEHGRHINKKIQEQVEKAYNNGTELIFHGYKTIMINTNHNVSEVGSYANTKGYVIALIWSVRNQDVICSLRSKTADVSKIATYYNGGGHKGASGFRTDFDFISLLYKNKT